MQKPLKQDKKKIKKIKKNPGKEGETLNQENGGREGNLEKRYAIRTPRHATLTNFDIFVVNYIKYDLIVSKISDQYQYLGNCPLTPSLTQQQSIDNKLGLMLG